MADENAVAVGAASAAPCGDDQRRISIIAASWEQVTAGNGEAALDPDGCDLTHFTSGRAPLLADHERHLGAVLGKIERAWLAPDGLHAIALLADTPRGREVAAMVADGIISSASIGYRGKPDEQPDGLRLIRRWRPFEICLVPMPADWLAAVTPWRHTPEEAEAAARAAEAARQWRLEQVERWQRDMALDAFVAASWRGIAARLDVAADLAREALAGELVAFRAVRAEALP